MNPATTHAVNIPALMQALPSSGLEPQIVALIQGLSGPASAQEPGEFLYLLEPHASHRTPFVEPVQLLKQLLHHQGISKLDASAQAADAVACLHAEWPQAHWVLFYDYSAPAELPCLPLQDVLQWLQSEKVRSAVAAED